MSDTFCINDDMVFLSFFTVVNNIIDDPLFIVVIFFRKENIFCAICDTAPQSNISSVSSHNFDNTYTLMRGRCITNFINRFHSCVYSSVKTNGVLCTCNVQVNGSRNTYCIYAQIRQFLRTCKRTISTDHHKAVDTMFFTDLSGSSLSLFCSHLCAAGSIQNCSALLDSI